MAGFNHWGSAAEAIDTAASQVVRKTALDAQGHIQGHIQANDQIDTGFMLGSVYTVTSEGSSYTGGEHALAAVASPPDNKTAYVGVAADYGEAQNYGTRYLPARPFFEPGMDDVRPGFDAAMTLIKGKMEEAAGR